MVVPFADIKSTTSIDIVSLRQDGSSLMTIFVPLRDILYEASSGKYFPFIMKFLRDIVSEELILRVDGSIRDPQESMRFMIEFPILPLMFFIILQNLTIQSRNFTKTILVKIICVIFI